MVNKKSQLKERLLRDNTSWDNEDLDRIIQIRQTLVNTENDLKTLKTQMTDKFDITGELLDKKIQEALYIKRKKMENRIKNFYNIKDEDNGGNKELETVEKKIEEDTRKLKEKKENNIIKEKKDLEELHVNIDKVNERLEENQIQLALLRKQSEEMTQQTQLQKTQEIKERQKIIFDKIQEQKHQINEKSKLIQEIHKDWQYFNRKIQRLTAFEDDMNEDISQFEDLWDDMIDFLKIPQHEEDKKNQKTENIEKKWKEIMIKIKQQKNISLKQNKIQTVEDLWQKLFKKLSDLKVSDEQMQIQNLQILIHKINNLRKNQHLRHKHHNIDLQQKLYKKHLKNLQKQKKKIYQQKIKQKYYKKQKSHHQKLPFKDHSTNILQRIDENIQQKMKQNLVEEDKNKKQYN